MNQGGVAPSIVMIRQDRTILLDGEAFFPFGFYYAGDTGTLEMLSRAGFNVTIAGDVHIKPAAMQRYLAAAYALDVKVIPGAHGISMHHKTKDISAIEEKALREGVRQFMDEPAILAWYIADEPDGGNIPFSVIERTANLVRGIDGNHPTWLVTIRPSCDPYAKASDIHSNDPYYPIWRKDLTVVRKYIDDGVNSAEGKKPYAATLFGADRGTAGRDLRTQTYLAIVRGARGVVFWALTYAVNHEGLMEKFSRLAQEIDDFSPVILASDSDRKATVKANGAKPDVLVKQYGGDFYVIAVNYVNKEITAAFDLTSFPPAAEVGVLYENRRITIKDNIFSDTFNGYDAHIYVLRGKEKKIVGESSSIRLVGLRPRPENTVKLAAPMIKAVFESTGNTEVAPGSVSVTLDGKAMGPSDGLPVDLKGVKKGISGIPAADLGQGPHRVVVRGKDATGKSFEAEWAFTTTDFPIPFRDAFEEVSGAWRPLSGSWVLKDGACVADPGEGSQALSVVTDINLRGDYTFEVTAMFDDLKQNSELLIWLNETSHPMLAEEFFPAVFKIHFSRERAVLSRVNENPSASGAIGPLEPRKWHRFKIVRQGRTITVFADEKKAFTYHTPYAENGGGFGIGVRGARVAFDEVVVKPLF
ncbi:MAG: hypothetical protein ABII06_09140 [Pseudomonadota bacterium]